MFSLFDKLKGYKTYLVALSGAVAALAAFASGTIGAVELITALYNAAAVFTLRAGIAASK